MNITNEEMEALNRASEILSKYAAQGGLTRADFDHYEKMVISIIDEKGGKKSASKGLEREGFANLKKILVKTKKGSFSILLKAIQLVDEDFYNSKCVDVLCVIENKNYKAWQGRTEIVLSLLSSVDSDEKTPLVVMTDQDGFSLETYGVRPHRNGHYIASDVPINTKKRICMPFGATENCTGVSIKIQGEKIATVTFDEKGNGLLI